MENQLIPFQPYLLRAAYDWLVDNGFTPYIEVNTDYPDTRVPTKYIQNSKIILDIAPRAVNHLKIDNEVVEFDARFGSKIEFVSVPISAIISIYSHESGAGIKLFNPSDQQQERSDKSNEAQENKEHTTSCTATDHLSKKECHAIHLTKSKIAEKLTKGKLTRFEPNQPSSTTIKSKDFLTLITKNKKNTDIGNTALIEDNGEDTEDNS